MKQKRVPYLLILLLLTWVAQALAQPNTPPPPPPISDSAEAAQVADWLRAAPPVSAAANHFSVIGAANFIHLSAIPEVRESFAQVGPLGVYNDPALYARALEPITRQTEFQYPLLAAGGLMYLRDVQNMPWGLVEVQAGEYRWEVGDLLITAAGAQGLHYVGTVAPYADWDQAALPATSSEMCQRLMTQDFFYMAYGGRLDRFQDMEALQRWLGLAVERYDGDGLDDAPGLVIPVKFWQIHNEPEGDQCGNYRGDEAAYVELLARSYATIKAACPDCQVMNGGAGIRMWETGKQGSEFWANFAALGGAQYLDIIAVHYNDGKHGGYSEANLIAQIEILQALLGPDKPLWLTEFGAMVENPNRPASPAGAGQPTFYPLSEAAAAAWYMQYYTIGLAHGADRFFSDVTSFVTMERQRLLPYYVNILLEAKIGPFTEAAKLADGQYRFMVNGAPVYVLWGGVPAEISGGVQVTDMYGGEQTLDASQVQPTAASPLIVELGP
jgi:hypothetical protein